jgi:DNA polymerase-3 subunit epsilon
MLGADLCRPRSAASSALQAAAWHAGRRRRALWLKVDSFSLLQALAYLAQRLVDEFEVKHRAAAPAGRGHGAQLDLVWSGQAMSTETVMSWEMDAMRTGTESSR